MNLCRDCKQAFGSVAAFDRHRVGVHAYTFAQGVRMEPPRYDGRRCLAVSELEELRDKHELALFARNARGTWSVRAGMERARGLNREREDGAG